MPKNFEFVGFRKYDPLAFSSGEQKYTEGIDYYGGDTQVYLTDLSVTNATPIRINCLRNLTGGGMYYDMVDTSCYGQLHKSYMQRQMDSEPVQTTISAMSVEAVELILTAFKGKRVVRMTILYPDSRYSDGMVRVERVDPNSAIDSVFEYVVTFRRVNTPVFGIGWVSADYDLRGGTRQTNFKDVSPYYTKGATVIVDDGTHVKPPLEMWEFEKFTAYNRLTGKSVDISGNQFQINDHTVIQANYKSKTASVKKTSGSTSEALVSKVDKEKMETLRAAFPETDEQYPIGTVITLPERPNLAIDKHWEIAGWTIDGKPYEFGQQYQIMGETVVEGRWQEMTIMEFATGANSAGFVPEPIRVAKGERVTVPPLATDPEGRFRAVGWRDEDRHVIYTPGQTFELMHDMTLTATWKPLHYVKYSVDRADVEEGTLPTDSNAYAAGDLITMPPLEHITREGYTFAGWERGSGDIRIYLPEEKYVVKPTDGVEIVFDAKWEEES